MVWLDTEDYDNPHNETEQTKLEKFKQPEIRHGKLKTKF